jgi:hypothetical protein
MGNSSRRFSFGNAGYSYGSFADAGGEPGSGAAESLQGVRIPIWSTKCVNARWFGPAAPVVDSDLQPVGTDRLQGTITNKLDVKLEDAAVAFKQHVYLVGTIEPHATIRVELARSDRDLSGYLKDDRRRYLDPTPGDPDYKIDRPALMLAAMFHDSISQIGNDRALANDAMPELDLTGQLALSRPMLVARVPRPASRLILDNAPSPPKVDQATVLRVLLPLNPAASGR